ncbi:MAG TPA: TetR/AcrR family transcriptional regulator [Nostocaceae cyanobacterium]|nr:TetR/AcrR family transcriptional regulator [Nostocaceae cyanobacterium]
MAKGEKTKTRILQQAAELFNQQGYAGSSISDIMRVTGLQKGGIYNHFKNKDELAIQAFEFAITQIEQKMKAVVKNQQNAIARLLALIDLFSSFVDNPTIKGGCPLLNTAVESDDNHPTLREHAQQKMNSWLNLISRIINKGIKRGEIKSEINADEVATIIISTLEGAIMMSKLYGDKIYMLRVVKHLQQYIKINLEINDTN